MPLIAKMPWDMVVFLTITTVGFGVSINRLSRPGNVNAAASSVEFSPDSNPSSHTRSGVLTMEMGCLERSVGIRSNNGIQGAVRLKGKFCDLPKNESKEALSSVKIRNTTTGQESMIYISGNDAFITDGISLHSGKNTLTMEWKSKDRINLVSSEVYGK